MDKTPFLETKRCISITTLLPQLSLCQTFGAAVELFGLLDCITGGATTWGVLYVMSLVF